MSTFISRFCSKSGHLKLKNWEASALYNGGLWKIIIKSDEPFIEMDFGQKTISESAHILKMIAGVEANILYV